MGYRSGNGKHGQDIVNRIEPEMRLERASLGYFETLSLYASRPDSSIILQKTDPTAPTASFNDVYSSSDNCTQFKIFDHHLMWA